MITFRHKGNFEKTTRFFNNSKKVSKFDSILNRYAQIGVLALRENTPIDTGLAASSWSYSIEKKPTGFSITWMNNDVTEGGTPVVILLQYGHGTGNGGYVQGYDFLNPTMKPIFDSLSTDLWEEVIRA